MMSGFGESTSIMPSSPPFLGSNNANDACDFKCNICFELAQDPIIILCCHLFYLPCLYRWLHHHSHCQECLICKASYKRKNSFLLIVGGKNQIDPHLKSYPGMEIPNHLVGQRLTTTALPTLTNQFVNYGFRLIGGFVPMATARIGNLTMGFGGLLPSLFNLYFYGFPDAIVYGTTFGFPHAFNTVHGGHAQGFLQPIVWGQQANNILKNLLLLIGVFVVLALLY